MRNGMAISALARQLKSSAERLDELTMNIEQFEQGNQKMVQTCQEFRMGILTWIFRYTIRRYLICLPNLNTVRKHLNLWDAIRKCNVLTFKNYTKV